MNIIINIFLIFFSTFPLWLFRFKIYENLLYFLILYCFIIIIFLLILKFLKKKNFFYFFFTSLIITYGFDNHLSLHRELATNGSLLSEFFGGEYQASFFIIFSLFIMIFSILLKLNVNGVKIFVTILTSIFLSSLFIEGKNIKNIKNYALNEIKIDKEPTIIIVIDEMSGISSYESRTTEGKIFDNLIKEFAINNNLSIYGNVYSEYLSSIDSISSLVNYNKNNNSLYITPNNFFENHKLKQNLLFDDFKFISVFQSNHINYCENINVKKCKQFNPFEKKIYITGFKYNTLTVYFNAWKLDGSIIAHLIWRIMRQFNFIDVNLSPQGEKASFPYFLDQIINDAMVGQFDLIFAHTLVPHKPYGYNKNCEYDGKRSLNNYNNTFSIDKHTLFHNIDRLCVIKFIESFLRKIEIQNIKYNKIIFLSDHGSRNVMNNPESSLKNILFVKEKNKQYKLINKKVILQNELKKIIDN